ncbi:MAG: (Fe-S)-binding protein, partial [Actinomycetota bacterium]
ATAMCDDKVAQIEGAKAEAVVAGDTGCLMHIEGRLARRRSGVRALHLATLLAEAAGLRWRGS